MARHVKVQNLNVNPGYRRRDGTVDLNEDEWSSSRHSEQDDPNQPPRSGDPDQISLGLLLTTTSVVNPLYLTESRLKCLRALQQSGNQRNQVGIVQRFLGIPSG